MSGPPASTGSSGTRPGDGREYPSRPLVGVGIIVLKPASVLLVRRGHAPSQGQWIFPGGAQELGETAEEAARRELLEETGLAVGPLSLVGYFDSIHRAADRRIQFHYTILDFGARYAGGEPCSSSDALELAWVAEADLARFSLHPQAMAMIGRARTLLG